MIRFLADADFNHAIVKGCQRQEPALDFLSANEAKLEGVPDPEVLALAAEQNRILITHDRQTMPHHFGEFLMSGRSCPGVFIVSQHAPIGEVIDELVLIWAASDADEWINRTRQLAFVQMDENLEARQRQMLRGVQHRDANWIPSAAGHHGALVVGSYAPGAVHSIDCHPAQEKTP
jgi:hypothetical protein